MDHEFMNKNNYLELKSTWEPYLRLDIISLAYVWLSYLKSLS